MEQVTTFLQSDTGTRLAQSIVVLAVMYFAVKIIQKTLKKHIQNSNARYQARKAIGFIGYTLAVLAIMLIYNYKFSNLTLALGLAGAGIAFALQEIIVSFAGFLAILFGNFYKIGDRIQLGGIKGDVVDIGILRTTIMEMGDWVAGDLYNGKMVRVANSFIFKEPVYNYSGEFPFLWDEITIPIRHGCNRELAKKMILDAVSETVQSYTASTKSQWQKLTEDLYVENAQIDPMITMAFDENW
ncbi:MAG: mechanosensitive ion channel, partial [Marinoscillum sp.]